MLTKEDIKQFLPHREPMLLVEEAEIVDGVAHCKYTIKEDEFFTRGHFPGNPIVPGVIQCEIMAQSCAVLVRMISQDILHCTPDWIKSASRM